MSSVTFIATDEQTDHEDFCFECGRVHEINYDQAKRIRKVYVEMQKKRDKHKALPEAHPGSSEIMNIVNFFLKEVLFE